MEFKTVVCSKIDANNTQFWNAVGIWLRNPHVANRRILASKEIAMVEIGNRCTEIFQRIETVDFSLFLDKDEIEKQTVFDMLGIVDYREVDYVYSAEPREDKVYLRVTKVLPRTPRIFSAAIEFTFLEKRINRAISLQKSLSTEKRSLGPAKPYAIQQCEKGYISISVKESKEVEETDPSDEWLRLKLFPRLLNWMKNNETKTVSSNPTSLSLVPTEKYAKLYEQLKIKYGKDMVKIWPENTDPMKFVYEDVAIATYLILLWEIERSERGTTKLQSFLDLGCGNGLLVYILFSEGHPGLGVDLRKRKIWDSFPADTPLQVRSLVPSSSTVFPEVDWIIGNHSDELTPWIPVIAARSSDDCRFFLLPCCPYEFDGSKYQRLCASKSQYSEYMEYVKSISDRCGFVTRTDRLRIPSTKRICLIGWERKLDDYGELDENRERAKEKRIQEIISAKTTLICTDDIKESTEMVDNNEWSCGFKVRDAVEKVRNCTRLEKTLIAEIVNTVVDQLLHKGHMIPVQDNPEKNWNAGGQLELSEIAASIPPETLCRLRNECGGLQTLLKNHCNIFTVMQGKVQLRIPGSERIVARKRRKKAPSLNRKVKPCWFHQNHPDGCPATELKCNYKHC